MGYIYDKGVQINKKNKNNLKTCLKENYILNFFNVDDDQIKNEKYK